MVIDTIARKTGQLLIHGPQLVEQVAHASLCFHRRYPIIIPKAYAPRNLGKQVIKTINAHTLLHRLQVFFSMRKILIHLLFRIYNLLFVAKGSIGFSIH